MFDISQTVKLNGTVREFQWMGPHCFIQLLESTPWEVLDREGQASPEIASEARFSRHVVRNSVSGRHPCS